MGSPGSPHGSQVCCTVPGAGRDTFQRLRDVAVNQTSRSSSLGDVRFDRIAGRARRYLNSLRQDGQVFPYPLQRGSSGSLLGTCFAVLVSHLFGVGDEVAERTAFVGRLLEVVDPASGLVNSPDWGVDDLLKPAEHSAAYLRLQAT